MAAEHERESLASSLTDLMTSLAVIFILLFVASLNNAQQAGENTRNLMIARLKAALREFAKQGLEVQTDPQDPLVLLVIIPEPLLQFEVDKTDIPPDGVIFLQKFTPSLSGATCSKETRGDINSITVEGHADQSGPDEYNLQLSQNRSMRVVQQMLSVLENRERDGGNLEQKECFLNFLSASGRGKRDPIRNRNGEEDKARSRRVVFKIRVRSVEQKELRQLMGSPPTSTPPAQQ